MDSFTTSIDSIFNFFINAYRSENRPDIKNIEPISKYNIENLILKNVDPKKIIKEYKESYRIFKEDIFFKEFNIELKEKYVFPLKNSYIMYYQGDENKQQYTYVSTEKAGLEIFQNFLIGIGKISNYTLTPIFSPATTLYLPYIYLLDYVYDTFSIKENIKDLIGESIDEYRHGKFNYSIRNMGLIAEEYLTMIYETLFREECEANITLKKLYEIIVTKVRETFHSTDSNSDPKHITADSIFMEVSDTIKRKKIKNSEILMITRTLLSYFLQEKSKINKNIKNIIDVNKDNKLNVFSVDIKANILELIEYRNTVSHKTRSLLKIDRFEALRAAYCLTTLLMWWLNKLKSIDWNKSKEEIIKNIVIQNKTTT